MVIGVRCGINVSVDFGGDSQTKPNGTVCSGGQGQNQVFAMLAVIDEEYVVAAHPLTVFRAKFDLGQIQLEIIQAKRVSKRIGGDVSNRIVLPIPLQCCFEAYRSRDRLNVLRTEQSAGSCQAQNKQDAKGCLELHAQALYLKSKTPNLG